VHLLNTHALLLAQSELDRHSGLHPSYGFPMYSGKHLHAPAPFLSWHTAFAPQGDGVHGDNFSATTGSVIEILLGENTKAKKSSALVLWRCKWLEM